MNYKECKEKYDIYTKSLESKKSQLKEKEQEIKLACSEYDSVSSIAVKTKEEFEDIQNKLNNYAKQKFFQSSLKLIGVLALVSIGVEIMLACSSPKGFSYALLFSFPICLVDVIALGMYSIIKIIRPEWIQCFWKNDKKFNELKDLVKTKEKELSIVETKRCKVNDNFVKCRKDIKTLEEQIAYIENDISELMLSLAPTLFSEEVDEQDKIQKKPYTRIRRPEDKN